MDNSIARVLERIELIGCGKKIDEIVVTAPFYGVATIDECKYWIYSKDAILDGSESIADENKTVVDMKAGDNKYLHRDFHLLSDLALRYCGEVYGDREVSKFIAEFAFTEKEN